MTTLIPHWPPGNSQMAEFIRDHDWSATTLGPVEQWPPRLRAAFDLILPVDVPMAVIWGPEFALVSNDGLLEVMGDKPPSSLGQPTREIWPEVWDRVSSIYERVMDGETVSIPELALPVVRDGQRDDAVFTFSHSPLRDDDGTIVGILVTALKTTDRTRVEREQQAGEERQAFLLKLHDALRPIADPIEVRRTALRMVAERYGTASAMYFDIDPVEDRATAAEIVDSGAFSIPSSLRPSDFAPWLLEVLATGQSIRFDDIDSDPRLDSDGKAAFRALGINAATAIPLVKGGQLVAAIAVIHDQSFPWSSGETQMLEEVAERTWAAVEQARAETGLRESEARYRSLFGSIDEGYALYEPIYDDRGEMVDVRIIEVNPAYEQLTRRPDPEGKTLNQVSSGLDPVWADAMSQVIRSGHSQRFQRHNRGIDRWFDVLISPVSDGDHPRIALILKDITEHKRAEDALRDSEERFRSLFESIDEAYALYELQFDEEHTPVDALVVEVNPVYKALMDRPDPEGKTLRELVPALGQDWLDAVASAVFSGAPHRFDRYSARTDRWFDVYVGPAPGPGSNRVVLVFKDITERKRALEALQRSEERFRMLFESIDQGFSTIEVIFDNDEPVDYRFLSANPAHARLTGFTNIVGRTIGDVRPEHAKHFLDIYGDVARTGEPKHFERFSEALGRHYANYAWRIGDPEKHHVAVLFDDITDRKLAEQTLQESEKKFRTLFETMGQGYSLCEIVRDSSGRAVDYRFIMMNPAFERLTGIVIADAVGHLISEILPGTHEWWLEIFERAVQTQIPQPFEDYFSPLDRWFEGHAYPAGGDRFIALYQEVTDRKRAEHALRESEERQAFLLALADALRPLSDPVEIRVVAQRFLGEWLGVDRVMYADVETTDGVEYLVAYDDNYLNPGTQPVAGRYSTEAFRSIADTLRRGEVSVCTDTASDPAMDDGERAALSAIGIKSVVTVPLVKEGRWVAGLGAQHGQPRQWTEQEIALVREVAERTWAAIERAGAENALRESEERYRALFEAIDQGFCTIEVLFDDGLPTDYRVLEVNPAFARNTGLGDSIGKRMRELAPAHEEFWYQIYGRVALTQEPARFEAEAAALGRWYNVFAYPVGNPGDHRVAVLFEDITERRGAFAALRASELRFRTLLQNLPDYAIFLLDPEGRIAEWSEGAERITGYTSGDVLGHHVALLYPSEAVAAGEPQQELARAASTGRVERASWLVRKNGERFWGTEIVTAVRDGAGNLLGFTKISRDLTEQRQGEEALRISEERVRAIVEEATDYAIFTIGPDGSIENWFPGAESVFGWDAEEAMGMEFADTFTPEDRAAGVPEQELEGARLHGSAPDVRWHQRQDGSRVFIDGTTRARYGPDGEFLGALKIGRNATEQRLAEQRRIEQAELTQRELQRQVTVATAELRALSRRLLVVQEEERRYLARELHDEIGQMLTGLSFTLSTASTSKGQFAEAQRIVAELSKQIRQLSIDLRPPSLDAYGLLLSMRSHVERYELQTGIMVDLRAEGMDRRFPASIEITTYRIVQEALTNVARHSQASDVLVQLVADDQTLTISIRDDGLGFDVAEVPGTTGLGGMRERAELVGGTFEIDTSPGAGVRITVELPLDDELLQDSPGAEVTGEPI